MHALAQSRFTGTSPAASILGCCAFHSMSEAPCLTEPHSRAGKNDTAQPFPRVNPSTRDLLLHNHCFYLQSSTTRSPNIRFDVSRYYRRGLQCTSPHQLDKSLVAPATARFAFIAACISLTEFIGVDIHRLDILWRVCCLLLWSSVEIWPQTPTISRKTGSKDSVVSPFVSISETLLKLDPLTQICRALSMSYIAEYVFDYGQLESSFVCALKHWKPQTVSFLELPPEIRNMIYNLLVNETKDRKPRLLDLEPGSFFAAPSLNMLHTCTQVQQELLPLYFSIITPCFTLMSRDRLRTRTLTQAFEIEALGRLDKQGSDAADYFRAISLKSYGRPYVDCCIKIHESMVVEAKVWSHQMYEGHGSHGTSASRTLAEKVTESLKLSNTGLLGLRHFEIAEEAIEHLQLKIESSNWEEYWGLGE
ncbi:hypothetical protein D6C84_09279 [Aureobasidium pullulans]|uniref:Uncharacterized protein n=1 Tax=Aureobasidium pullulans TaxID=5580 RepID=A0A4S9X7C7_AURPU|nr:hypothetical protein D6C84_09279 [Aureobasidium pullulans]